MKFLSILNTSVSGKMISDAGEPTAVSVKIIAILDHLSKWIDEIPPLTQGKHSCFDTGSAC